MKHYRIGIVGLGWVAGAHIEAFKSVQGADVVAVCSRRALDAATISAQFGTPLAVTSDFNDLLADDSIDIIDICTPHPLHPEQAIAAARAGKHLIIEKPIGIDWQSCVAVRDALREAQVQACVCFEVRFSRQAQAIRAALDKNLLGDVHYAEVDYYHGIGPWYGQYAWNIKKDFGGSSLLTAGCHALDLLRHYLPGQIEEVTCYATQSKNPQFTPYEYPTTTVSLLRFADGQLGKVTSCIDCLQPYYFHQHLVGSEGSILDEKLTSLQWPGLSKDLWTKLGVPTVDSGDVSDHPYPPQFQAFIDALQENRPMLHTDFATAFETHKVVFAAELSATERRPVKLSEFAS
ncbi:Gfo/Idh/MocA family protein [Armatimonas sp.]|uniref:Gfo/Idh/MocA family protein n=1 Tax=Armatimonas sp. TaxID=1872638 RepID=UPI003751306E